MDLLYILFLQSNSGWQDFNWHSASRGPSAVAELLVSCHLYHHYYQHHHHCYCRCSASGERVCFTVCLRAYLRNYMSDHCQFVCVCVCVRACVRACVCVCLMSVVPSFPDDVAIRYAIIVMYLWFYRWRITAHARGTSIDIVAESDVIASRRLQSTIALLAVRASMRSGVYVTVGRPSVRLSVCSIDCQRQLRPAGLLLSAGELQQISIDSCGRRRSAANAGSIVFTADGGDSQHRLVYWLICWQRTGLM